MALRHTPAGACSQLRRRRWPSSNRRCDGRIERVTACVRQRGAVRGDCRRDRWVEGEARILVGGLQGGVARIDRRCDRRIERVTACVRQRGAVRGDCRRDRWVEGDARTLVGDLQRSAVRIDRRCDRRIERVTCLRPSARRGARRLPPRSPGRACRTGLLRGLSARRARPARLQARSRVPAGGSCWAEVFIFSPWVGIALCDLSALLDRVVAKARLGPG